MADQDPYAATAIKAPAAPAGDPYAATATQDVSSSPNGVTIEATPYQPFKPIDYWNPAKGKSDRERFLDPSLYPVGKTGEPVSANLHNIAQRGGVGVFQLANALVHPGQTARSMASSLLPDAVIRLLNKAPDAKGREIPTGAPNPIKQAYDAVFNSGGPWQTAGNVAPMAGQMIAGEAGALAVPAIAGDLASGAESLARTATDTGARPVEQLVKDTRGANEKIDAVNDDRIQTQQTKQAKADADYHGDLLKLKQGYEQDVRDAQETARTGTAADREQYQGQQLAAKQKYDQAVRNATEKYQTDKAAAEEANAKALREYNQKIGQTIQKNRAVATTEQGRSASAAHTQVAGSQLIYRLNKLDGALRDRAGTMYDAIREKVGGASLPGTGLAVAAKDALSKISGTSETPKIFRDILGKFPEAEPETISYQGAQVPKGTPLYDVLAQHGAVSAPPATFADLQGYYSELGKELSKGTLPGDVYQATRALQDSVGDMMQKLADGAGVGKQLTAARKFYRDYMDTFHEPTGPSSSGSPIAQALLAKDPQVAVQKFSGTAGDRGIAALRKYDSDLADLAQRARTVRQATPPATRAARQPIASIPGPKTKPVPTGPSLPLPPVLENTPVPRAANLDLPPVLPEPKTVPVDLKPRQTISSTDIEQARGEAATARRNFVNRRGGWVASWPIFEAMRAVWGGHIPSIPAMGLESAGTLAMVKATSAMMNYPPMLDFLTQARPEDIALIPPDLRGDLPGLVNLARRQRIRVAPALIAATAGTANQAAAPAGR